MYKELEDWLHEEKTTGRAEGKLEDALEMLKDGIPFEKIAKYTKLPMQSIEDLAKQHKLA